MRSAVIVVLLVVAVVAGVTASACRGQGSSSSTGDAAAAADGASALPLPPEVQAAPSVCTLKTELFRPFADVPIRANGTTGPYATAIGVKPGVAVIGRRELRADLGIPSDDDMPFSLRVYGGTFDIRGLVDRTLPIYPGMPLALGAFAAALPHTELKVVRATALEVEVEAQIGESIEIVGGPPRARGPCGLFAFERRDFSPSAVIPGVKWKSQPDALLKKGHKIALTKLPIGEPIAHIQIRPGDSAATVVFEKEKDRAHIGWYGSTLMIHGWIAASELEPLPKDAKPAEEPPAPKKPDEPAPSAKPPEPLVCPAPVPLVALVGDSRTTVGSLHAGGAFDVIGRDKGWAEVRGHVPLLAFASNTRLVVRESDLALCSAPKAAAAPKAAPPR
jgi:hypothetical protein